jgi:two-component system sensor histidine kinase PilS (NtrC family)
MSGPGDAAQEGHRGGSPASGVPSAHRLLRWIYVGRVTVALVVFAAAGLSFQTVAPATILILANAALASLIVSGLAVWHTHIRERPVGLGFLYSQALFDLALVTTVVHVMQGPASQFPALYVPVIAVYAVLMPLASSLLITSLASLLYLVDIVWWYPVQLSVVVWIQIAVFLSVFLATALIASRVRVVGVQHAELQEEVQRLKLEASDILRNIRSGIMTVDGNGNFAYANPAAQELLGLPDDLLEGRPFVETLETRAPELCNAVKATQRTGYRLFRADGYVRLDDRVRPIGFTTMALDVTPGQVPSVTAIFTDISQQKRLEELHLRTERLEAVAELSASLAHEIKNPLASIRSSVEQLSRSARTSDDERSLALLVVRESDRLARLLSEFLDFSRVQVTESHPIDLSTIARTGVDVVRNHPDCPEDAEIQLRVEHAHLEGDEDLLHRVIVNLVLNAVQASRGNAQIVVEVRPARRDDLPLGVTLDEAVLLRVTDNGPGVPQDIRERLFDPFVTGRAGGSGLGLAIVQRAVGAHRGYVWVDSVPGGGTTFVVLLPTKGTTEVAA